MIGRDSNEDRQAYGVWPWVIGVLFAVVMMWALFQLAVPID